MNMSAGDAVEFTEDDIPLPVIVRVLSSALSEAFTITEEPETNPDPKRWLVPPLDKVGRTSRRLLMVWIPLYDPVP